MQRYLGIDIGTESIKLVELVKNHDGFEIRRRRRLDHGKSPAAKISAALDELDWKSLDGAVACGYYARLLNLPSIPSRQARITGFRFHFDPHPATLVTIGSHGFSVLELHDGELQVYRENSRCSQGTGNFLRQLVERFDLEIEQASSLCASIDDPAPLSGRCPVILKTDMTHLANQGVSKARILAGLYDAVCENVRALINPRTTPPRLLLSGGVSRAQRIRDNFHRFGEQHGIVPLPADELATDYLDALGAALEATRKPSTLPAEQDLLQEREDRRFVTVPALSAHLEKVRQMPPVTMPTALPPGTTVVLGFDIGSTGSKAVAISTDSGQPLWESYLATSGDPVKAAQRLLHHFINGPAATAKVLAIGTTGSGREIVGSLFTTCLEPHKVFVLNEIAAHAAGAHHFDPRVDTIFEIGGQDAKYIRLDQGRVVDAAMNEACSAGTGSFIEEQGRKFDGIADVQQLAGEALSATAGLSLGQHCSVFMAEIIDDAVAAGVDRRQIVAGIYDSVIQNYLNRVMGSRSVGEVIFCQGMPFAAKALAAAVARQTGSEVIVPPNPGTVGALGIALLAWRALPCETASPVDLGRLLEAEITQRDTFVCGSSKGCGEPGNKCRIDRLKTRIGPREQRFTWGGACSLWEHGTGRSKLPDLTPDPFRDRQLRIDDLCAGLPTKPGRPSVGLTDEFLLKELFPFFAVYLDRLGFNVITAKGGRRKTLKRGIEEAEIPYCAPMQLYHGVIGDLVDTRPDILLLPMLRSLPRVGDEPHACTCPIVQGSADILINKLANRHQSHVVSPVLDIGSDGLASREFRDGVRDLARLLGRVNGSWEAAYDEALKVQAEFDAGLLASGRQALNFCNEHGISPIVILGRPYTLYNTLLNANLPALLREQGAVPIPVDCYPVDDGVPILETFYWGQGQRNLRAASQVRESAGIYSLWASNYSCGPDSFNLYFYAHLMAGKPFTVIETDGHAGDAGTKTRIEAFLHCVREDQANTHRPPPNGRHAVLSRIPVDLTSIRKHAETVLIPRLGSGADVLAACLRGVGIDAEALPTPDRESLRLGRRYTSGKECVPMTLTLGCILKRLAREDDPERHFAYLMPTTDGPCRFGTYHTLHRLILERLGHGKRVRLWSPSSSDNYFDDVPAGFSALVLAGFSANDVLLEALHDSRPVESRPGAANRIYRHYQRLIVRRVQTASVTQLALPKALFQAAYGALFGLAPILDSAGRAFAKIRSERHLPRVLVAGEIFVRCDPFSNGNLIERLELHGLRVHLAPFSEWLEYIDQANRLARMPNFDDRLYGFVRQRIQERCHTLIGNHLGWRAPPRVADMIDAAAGLVRPELECETILTVGGALHEWRQGRIDAMVNVGPLECMPCKIAEAQLLQAAKNEQLLSLSLPTNGDSISQEQVDSFAYEVHARFAARQTSRTRDLNSALA